MGRRICSLLCPITKAHLGQGMSVGELAAAAVFIVTTRQPICCWSEIGGVQASTALPVSWGIRHSGWDRIEPHLNSAIPGDERDTTTPLAMVRTLQAMTLGWATSGAAGELAQGQYHGGTEHTSRCAAALERGGQDGWRRVWHHQ